MGFDRDPKQGAGEKRRFGDWGSGAEIAAETAREVEKGMDGLMDVLGGLEKIGRAHV